MTNDQAEQIIALLNQIAALLTEMQNAMIGSLDASTCHSCCWTGAYLHEGRPEDGCLALQQLTLQSAGKLRRAGPTRPSGLAHHTTPQTDEAFA